MLERLGILLIVFALGMAACYALRAWAAWRLRRLQAGPPPAASPLAEVMASIGAGGPALLYFTTADCAQCRFQQTPILQRFQAQPTAPPVITLDAVQRQDLARHFGILTVPSTVLLNSRRVPVAINHGLAPLHKLQAQAAQVE